MHIAIAGRTAKGLGVLGVLQVDEDEARSAGAGAWLGADGHGVVLFLVDDDVVG